MLSTKFTESGLGFTVGLMAGFVFGQTASGRALPRKFGKFHARADV